jgi:hypothetical protein
MAYRQNRVSESDIPDRVASVARIGIDPKQHALKTISSVARVTVELGLLLVAESVT